MGLFPFLIRQEEISQPISFREKIKFYLLHPLQLFRRLFQKPAREAEEKAQRIARFNREHPRPFESFISKHLNTTPITYDRVTLREHPPEADVYLAGSDQIWTLDDFDKLLNFAPPGKRIAYAASANWGKQSKRWFIEARKELPYFTGISVRETEGREICQKAGMEQVEVVLDPTLLLDPSEYTSLVTAQSAYLPPDSILGYFLNTDALTEIYWNQILDSFKGNPLRIIPLQGAECCIPEKYSISPNPYEFLQSFQEALCIITNSFHGTVFALIMRKPFITILQKGETAVQNTRIFSLLESLGLEDRIYHPEKGSMAGQLNRPINWTAVERNWEALRIHSMEFLKNAIQQCTSATRHG
ncbi:polysaccharide pyruvyl transferase family protein [Akkermansia muciniphila]|uniref:polysaccharide pyruvyl transferase family protein n=1 Tax=Akkermansia muciniphila TaxID=239935 RepID=UPI002285C76C|nr:polysaccharide pyruvyl transferase family protein [Akkermansia muciniphila]